jgi:hypothetical protein
MKSLGNEPLKPHIRINVTVSEAPPVPDLWALITGDILTNLRGALDHAVFPHIRAQKPELDRKYIQYPIEDRKDTWENQTRWFDRPVLKGVGESQPYRDPNRAGNPLRVLRELVNMDKHRDLVIAIYSVDDFEVAPQDLFKVISRTAFITEMVPGARRESPSAAGQESRRSAVDAVPLLGRVRRDNQKYPRTPTGCPSWAR